MLGHAVIIQEEETGQGGGDGQLLRLDAGDVLQRGTNTHGVQRPCLLKTKKRLNFPAGSWKEHCSNR